MTVLAFVLRLC